MDARSFVFAAVALFSISPVFADAQKGAPVEPQRVVREYTVIEELAAGMREVLRAVVPDISLPALELKLPTLDRAAR